MNTDNPDRVRKFRDHIDDLQQKALQNSVLSLKGWIDYGELDLMAKQSLSLSQGCIRHVLYLVLHLGSYVNCPALVAGLVNEYRQAFKSLIWTVLPHRDQCRMALLQQRLPELDHLLHVIIDRLKPAVSHGNDEVKALFPCPPRALAFHASAPYQDIQLLKKIIKGQNSRRPLPPLFSHLLFLTVMQGFAEKADSPSLSTLQRDYRSGIRNGLVRLLVEQGTAAPRCANDPGDMGCFGSVFDMKADEGLVRIACEYRIRMLSLKESETNDRTIRDFREGLSVIK